MSRPRYAWWPYVKAMVRQYPERREQYAALHSPSMTADYSGIPRAGGVARGTEEIALRELPTTAQREYEAVRKAIEQTERYRNGRDRLMVIRLVLWDRSHTLQGAALIVPCSWRTAAQWHREFIKSTAKFFGLMDE